MASIQKRCRRRVCRRGLTDGARSCPECSGRSFGYIARWRDPDGIQRSQSFQRRTDAERFLHDTESSKTRGNYIDPAAGRVLLRDFYETWLVRAKAGGLAPSTASKYERTWRLDVEPALGATALARITRDDVRAMVATVAQRSPWQAAEALKLARVMLNSALDADRIGRNPAARIEAPRTERSSIRVLRPQEIAAIVEALPPRWRAFVLLGAYSSLRWSELVAVKRDDLDLSGRTVGVDEKLVEVDGRFEWGAPKTARSNRVVDLPDVVVAPLLEHLLRFPPLVDAEDPNLEGLVFSGERGGPVRRHVFRPIWQRACEKAGVEGVRPEWLRHTGASLAYAATKDMKAVASRLGHTSTRMMDTVYVEVYPEVSRQVADAIDALVRASLDSG